MRAETGERYLPRPGDFLERRGSTGAEHAMMMLRWIPGDQDASDVHHRHNRAVVLNGPWPVTVRLVRVHEDELGGTTGYWLGRLD